MHETEVQAADDLGGGPGDEPARGPHLPDVLGRAPWLAWIFVLLAVGYLVWFVRSSNVVANPSASDVVVYILRLIPSLVAILLPAALLARHPDAMRRAPTLLFGTILFAAVQGMLILAEPLQPFFESLTPASEELPFLVPLAAAFSVLIGLVSAFGLAYIGLGLTQARRYEGGSSAAISLIVPVAAVLATIAGILSVARLDLGSTPMSPPLAIYLASSVFLGILRVTVWAYLTAVATRGSMAGEEPRAGWQLVVVGGAFVLVALALVNVSGLLDLVDDALVTAYGYAVSASYSLGHLALLAAFAIGLPSLDPLEDEEDDDFDDDFDDEDDLDEEYRDFDDEDDADIESGTGR